MPAPSVSLDSHLLAESGEQFVLFVTACVWRFVTPPPS
jgi:hypothetical protein